MTTTTQRWQAHPASTSPYRSWSTTTFPVNASKLLLEWEYGLNPVEALAAALTSLSDAVAIRDRFVVPSSNAVSLMRTARADRDVVDALRHSVVVIDLQDLHDPRVSRPGIANGLVDPGEDKLSLDALPLLYGAALLAALRLPHSYHARTIRTAVVETLEATEREEPDYYTRITDAIERTFGLKKRDPLSEE